MISRTHRFRGHNSLSFAYQHGKTVRGRFINLKYAHNPRRSSFRAAVVVSKKVHKSAVVRNRIRRRIFELVRTSAESSLPYDLIFSVFDPAVAEMPAPELRAIVVGQLSAAGLVMKSTTDTRK